MKKFLIIKTGGALEPVPGKEGDFEHWTAEGMGLELDDCLCVDVQKDEPLPSPDDILGAVITGSHEMVTDDTPWIHTTAAWVRETLTAGTPMLGICFGHQLMADALGGKAGYHPKGLEIGTVPVTLTEDGAADPLLGGLAPGFSAHVTHSQTALKLPHEAVLLATSAHDAHQSFRVGPHAWGVQFHPEFDAAALLDEVDQLSETITEKGGDAAAVRASIYETPESTSLLVKFVEYCRNR
ncbi:glutamine amidotransferase [Pseudodesulfovibrio sediminis]|uniref:GMP synthase n=1 Tax=Pseudodesulfovibrio sediminis TaxID=2810563 RepID=A0ABN6ETW0_9BACT|nr:glutamine amidotransferase [Pseudodesulfovibrio sediminis]BCS88619.1 GMP synthase [Pseudodesulfovibrio sediminis]